ncbi:hypothetical protein GE21DRAFT_8007 [Neurospora crassa]|uniref:Uncharacterized protein n=1 Tax=Neurospora crassa (strain ATCC 24698 / 74-OR23-1A / CBS 708.71 / DSM 1257 / FGSC 987) TaxID=367110 RepID=A7UWZ7_NEUCR|nr:hypothetical protein NCU10951 [Neurospora crassa OR74A]EDO65442.2 hypothetical protein NCU10951 [Neurospora crassa OR74A]KHE83638.1 hypothetical protein GE21DRAFT_8007 [Neurospora crassa]|eukprot:XP_001728533.2 hypothetical protein NCU10951 [Neurospora crassa OR74A]
MEKGWETLVGTIAVAGKRTHRVAWTVDEYIVSGRSAATGGYAFVRCVHLHDEDLDAPGRTSFASINVQLAQVHNSKALMHASQNVYNQIHMAAGLSVFAHPACV